MNDKVMVEEVRPLALGLDNGTGLFSFKETINHIFFS